MEPCDALSGIYVVSPCHPLKKETNDLHEYQPSKYLFGSVSPSTITPLDEDIVNPLCNGTLYEPQNQLEKGIHRLQS